MCVCACIIIEFKQMENWSIGMYANYQGHSVKQSPSTRPQMDLKRFYPAC